jgi:hypothetical protein
MGRFTTIRNISKYGIAKAYQAINSNQAHSMKTVEDVGI